MDRAASHDVVRCIGSVHCDHAQRYTLFLLCLVHIQRPKPVGSLSEPIKMLDALCRTTCSIPPGWYARDTSSSVLWASTVFGMLPPSYCFILPFLLSFYFMPIQVDFGHSHNVNIILCNNFLYHMFFGVVLFLW